jgi:hypothetical protein
MTKKCVREIKLFKHTLDRAVSVVEVDRAALPSNQVQETPTANQNLTSVEVTTFHTTNTGTVIRNDDLSLLDYHVITNSNALQLASVEFDNDKGILSLVRKDGTILSVSGFSTLKSLGTGSIGRTGPKGVRGQDGQNGRDGPDGYDGLTGPQGPTGPIGIAGADGSPGKHGRVGPEGPPGPQGMIGPEGPQGRLGHIGEPGYDGCTGVTGPTGPTGPKPSGSFYISSVPPDQYVLLWGYPV